jgi:hypothetical protein
MRESIKIFFISETPESIDELIAAVITAGNRRGKEAGFRLTQEMQKAI